MIDRYSQMKLSVVWVLGSLLFHSDLSSGRTVRLVDVANRAGKWWEHVIRHPPIVLPDVRPEDDRPIIPEVPIEEEREPIFDFEQQPKKLIPRDPCLEGQHRRLNDSFRSVNYDKMWLENGTFVLTRFKYSPFSDANLEEGWYRFVSPAGGYVPTSCPPDERACRTLSPVWMNGNLPEIVGEESEEEFCIRIDGNCTGQCFPLRVKNCGDFAVYRLKPVEVGAYCAGTEVECTNEVRSLYGNKPRFSPSCYEDLSLFFPPHPALSLMEEDDFFYLSCELVEYSDNSQYEIEFLSEKNVFSKKLLEVNDTVALLREDKLLLRGRSVLGSEVSCRGRQVLPSNPRVTSSWSRSSNTIFLGIKFVDAERQPIKEVTVSENQKAPSIVYLDCTFPIKCNSASWQLISSLFSDAKCKSSVRVKNRNLTDFASQLQSECPREVQVRVKDLYDQVDFSTCNIDLTPDNWKDYRSHRLLISAIDEKVYDGRQTRYVSFDISGSNQDIWMGYEMPYLKVVVEDSRQKGLQRCTSYNDPHMTTFDQLYYHNYLEGEFVLYENLERNYRVHVYYKSCNGVASCNCGVAAQAGDDVIIVDRCKKFSDVFDSAGMSSSTRDSNMVRQRFIVRGNLTTGFSLEQVKGTSNYKIKFPHGAEVLVTMSWSNFVNVAMTPAASDLTEDGKHAVRGLCGTYSGVTVDDFLLPDGTVYKHKSSDYDRGQLIPNTFNRAWRIPSGDERSLYNGNIRYVTETDDFNSRFCACAIVSGTESVVCKFTDQCTPVKDISGMVMKRTKARRRRREAIAKEGELESDYAQDFDDSQWTFTVDSTEFKSEDMTWPAANGMTEEAARQHCKETLEKSSMHSTCNKMQEVTTAQDLSMCMTDIMLTGTVDYAATAVESNVGKCMETVLSDPKHWEENKNFSSNSSNPMNVLRMMPPAEILDQSCLNSCSLRGTCVEGHCMCNERYTGADCSADLDAVPEVVMLPSLGLCDVNVRMCRSSPVIGMNFVDTEKLTCHLEEMMKDSSGSFSSSGVVHQTRAEFESYMEVHCPLPKARARKPTTYRIALSNDGVRMSATLPLAVYDSRCQLCQNASEPCDMQEGRCLIDDACFEYKDKKEGSDCFHCDPSKSVNKWSKIGRLGCILPVYVVIVIVAALVLIIIVVVIVCIHKQRSRSRGHRQSQQEPEDVKMSMLHAKA